MSGFSIKLTDPSGAESVFLSLEGIEGGFRKAIRKGFIALGRDLKAEADREILRKPKRGRVYFVRSRSGRPRRHVASAPGETHANLSGDLRRSIQWRTFGDELLFGYGIRDNSEPLYAPFVEFGTSRMAARPSLANAVNVTQREAEVNFRRALERAMAAKR